MKKRKRPAGVFISYRHQDTKHATARIYRRFKSRFGRRNIFIDMDSLAEGEDFGGAINKRLNSCQAALIIIGPNWLSVTDREGNSRLEHPGDWVRREVETVLAREPAIKCIPILVDGARLPAADQLPESISELSRRHAFTIPDDPLFSKGVDLLIERFNPRTPWRRVSVLGALIVLAVFGVGWALNWEPGGGEVADDDDKVEIPIPESDLTPPRIGETHMNSLGMRFKPIVGSDILVSAFETRVAEYQRFAEDTGIERDIPNFGKAPDAIENYVQSINEPVTMVSWDEANAFCEWLTKIEKSEGFLKGHQHYRLPTDEEWSLAAKLGDEPVGTPAFKSKDTLSEIFPWEGGEWPPPNNAGNYGGLESKSVAAPKTVNDTFRDGYPFTSRVGAFPANTFGIHDLGGNVWEWCRCRIDTDSERHVLRGGSWNNVSKDRMMTNYRNSDPPNAKFNNVGFRCVVDFAKP